MTACLGDGGNWGRYFCNEKEDQHYWEREITVAGNKP